MHLFSRTVHFNGPAAEVGAHAIALRDHVTARLGTEVALWSVGFGAPVGTMTYTARIDGLAGVAAMAGALAGDAEYSAMLAKGAGWVSGAAVDTLREPLNGALSAAPPPVGSVATVTTAVIANGNYAEAVGWGMDVASHVGSVTGMPVTFLMDMFGTFGQVVWIGAAADAAAADAANAQLAADAAYLAKLGTAGPLFVDGASHRSLAMRIA